MYNIVHVSSEVVPFSKTGGLADVANALPKALAKKGHKVTIFTPLYSKVDREKHGVTYTGVDLNTCLGGRCEHFRLHASKAIEGVTTILLENDEFFGREELYTTPQGDYPDNYLRFAFFSAAVLEAMDVLGIKPDVVHLHDWQSALIAAYSKVNYGGYLKIVFTIHNLGYQGLFPADIMEEIGLDWSLFNPEGIEFYGKVNYLKAGLVFADKITTVSPTYAQEIQTPQMGNGLDGILRKRSKDLVGILNGVDYDVWSPQKDTLIPCNYDAAHIDGKRICKKALLKEYGLEEDLDQPLFGVVGRLAYQKGFDVLASVLPRIVKTRAQLVLLGTGEPIVEKAIKEAAEKAGSRVSIKIAYDNRLAHLIEAGSDFFVMPSRYEPCGLNQMYSMKYGTIPVVHAVGGLKDTVIDMDEGIDKASGFNFKGLDANNLYCAMVRAVELYRRPDDFNALRRRIMGMDFSWSASAQKYEELYKSLVEGTDAG